MTKEVLVSISGLQFGDDMDETIELVTSGEYYEKNGKRFILYDEMLEGNEEVTKNTIKISDTQIELLKKGIYNVNMIFEEKKKNMTYYNTPFGNLLFGINTNHIIVEEEERKLHILIKYGLEVNYEFVSDCTININITSKG